MYDDHLWTGRAAETVGPGEPGDAGTTRLAELHHAIPPHQRDGTKAISLCARTVLVWGQRTFDAHGPHACPACAQALQLSVLRRPMVDNDTAEVLARTSTHASTGMQPDR